MKTIILTDSNCDLDGQYLTDNKIEVIPIKIYLNGNKTPLIKSYSYLFEENTNELREYMDNKEFYDKIRNGEIATTSQIAPYDFKRYFDYYISKGNSIIYIGFSSGLSSTFNNAIIASREITDRNEGADITIIDTKSATSGQGLLVYYANEMLKAGKTKTEVENWLKDSLAKVQVLFTVDDLEHLKRGGRISQTTANIGTLLSVKPIMKVNEEGKLVPIKKIRGRKKAITELFELLKLNITDSKEQTIFINHGDSLKDAEYLKKMITDNLEVKDIIINWIGPVIGAHTGSGVLSVGFLGNM
jgi:DegV family protein with EDD domain